MPALPLPPSAAGSFSHVSAEKAVQQGLAQADSDANAHHLWRAAFAVSRRI